MWNDETSMIEIFAIDPSTIGRENCPEVAEKDDFPNAATVPDEREISTREKRDGIG